MDLKQEILQDPNRGMLQEKKSVKRKILQNNGSYIKYYKKLWTYMKDITKTPDQ